MKCEYRHNDVTDIVVVHSKSRSSFTSIVPIGLAPNAPMGSVATWLPRTTTYQVLYASEPAR